MARDNAATDPAATNDVTLRLVAAYLAVTAVPVLRTSVNSGTGAIVACLHLLTLAGVLAMRRFGKQRTALASWLPLVLLPALYAEVPSLIAGVGSTLHDNRVQSWELGLFGVQPARSLASALPNRAVSELLHAGYVAYYAVIYLPPLLLFMRGRRAELAATVLAITTVWLACLVAFVVFPVAGPRYVWPQPSGIPQGPVRSFALWLLERGSARGTAFPSSHVAISVVQSLTALRFQRSVGVVAAVTTAVMATGAVYGGFHYAIDIAAGAGLGVLVYAAVFSNAAVALRASRWRRTESLTETRAQAPE